MALFWSIMAVMVVAGYIRVARHVVFNNNETWGERVFVVIIAPLVAFGAAIVAICNATDENMTVTEPDDFGMRP